MHPMVDRPPTTELTVNGGGASSISDTCEDGSNPSATEADDKTEADDVEVAVKLAGPQPMSEGRRRKKKTIPLQVIYNITGCR